MLILELLAAAMLGLVLLWLAFDRDQTGDPALDPATDSFEDTAEGRALLAIKDLEFDRETGKIADPDYHALREKLTEEAAAVLAIQERAAAIPAGEAPSAPQSARAATCSRCRPRPEPDATFCSACGAAV
ncbi:MAG: hypothetical protein FJ206_11460 [Gemmatimonadetes bacterium]|nr:hypothetical protein [Gemmatimonadota bacterium]